MVNPHIHKNGNIILLETSGSPYYDENGNPCGFRGNNTDITQRIQGEEALREQEQTVRAITSSVRDALILIDHDGNISFWNKAASAILGYSREEVFGKNLHELIVPKQFIEQYRRAIRIFQTTGTGSAIGKTLEVVALHKDQHEIAIELSLSSVELKGKWCAVGILRDITERRRAEEQINNLANSLRKIPIQFFDWISKENYCMPIQRLNYSSRNGIVRLVT